MPPETKSWPCESICSPELLRLARHSALGGCGLSAGVLAAGPVQPMLLLRAADHCYAQIFALRPWTARAIRNVS